MIQPPLDSRRIAAISPILIAHPARGPLARNPMRPPRILALACLLLAPSAALAGSLATDVATLVRSAKLPGAEVSVSVREVGTGEALVAIRAERPLIPASNMKLLTTGAALAALGPEFRFRTFMALQPGDRNRIVVVGDGDPAFGDPELLASTIRRRPDGSVETGLDVDSLLAMWADAVAGLGLTRIDDLIVDDRVFDRDRIPDGWPEDQLNEHYCAEVAGLNFHANCLHLSPRPAGGRAVAGDFTPKAPWIDVANRATAKSGSKDRHDAWLAHNPGDASGGGSFTLFGNVRDASASPIRTTLRDPATFFGLLLADRLRARGIEVSRVRLAETGEIFADDSIVGPAVSTPLATVLDRANSDSRNLHAECLFKRIGHAHAGGSASWGDGDRALRSELVGRVSPTLLEGVVFADGSGLSRLNRVRADLMTAWLDVIHDDPSLRGPFLESLAVAGERGTLRKRFRGVDLKGCEVLAKSGFINGVSCLSGYVIAPSGRTIAFSVLCNGVRSVADAKLLQEKIAARIAEEIASPLARR
jgi:D-alanyl-D-alanine carboxypeptidase/D-alanyl-D-alanine-endopeptidase (penicillin-binding protein 4)